MIGLPAVLRQARAYSARGKYKQAESCLRRALPVVSIGSSKTDRPVLWNELGMVSKYLGKLDSAERYYRLALRYARRCVKSSERDFFLANLYHNLGGVEHSRRRFSRGERYARRGLTLRLKCDAPDSVAVASDRAALAAILDGLRCWDESRKLYRQALRTYYQSYGRSHPDVAVVLNNLAAVYQATGSPQTAEKYYRAALRMKQRILGPGHPDAAITMNNLAMLYEAQGSHKLAATWFDKAIHLLESTLGSPHPSTISVRCQRLRLNQAGLSSLSWQAKRVVR